MTQFDCCDVLGLVGWGLSTFLLIYVVHLLFHTRKKVTGCVSKMMQRSIGRVDIGEERREHVRKMREELIRCSKGLKSNSSYEAASQSVSDFMRSGLLTADSTIRGPGMVPVWDLHSYCGSAMVGGADVRTTVQLNLFTGSVMNLGNEEQKNWMRETFKSGQLGAFFLTEKNAGVLSGLIVQTTATWTPKGYIVTSPDPHDQSMKNWISQGLTAKWGVVIARLILPNQEDKGAHAFLVDMELPGIRKIDMPRKTDFNCLDNVQCIFDDVLVPHDSLLSGISYVDDIGRYVLRDPKVPFNFVMVAQRLLSGRICIAGVALSFLENIIDQIEKYGRERMMPIESGKEQFRPLIEMPFLADQIDVYRSLAILFRHYVSSLENEYMNTRHISEDLVHRIACAKSEIVNFAIDATEKLKKVVGSYALFEESPWGTKSDILYVLRFAEGDSAILQQKMARDAVRSLSGFGGILRALVSVPFDLIRQKNSEGLLRAKLTMELVSLGLVMSRTSKNEMVDTWLSRHQLISSIARKISVLTILDEVSQIRGVKDSREWTIFRHFYLSDF